MNKKCLIIGFGLLGGSLLMALAKNAKYDLYGWARKKNAMDWAVNQKLLSAEKIAMSLEDMLKIADLIVLALPIQNSVEFMKQYGKFIKPGAVITDVGSTKQTFMTQAAEIFAGRPVNYIGSHPMAGTEKSGFANAFPTLFDNANVFICAPAGVDAAQVVDLWQSIGCETTLIDAKAHDKLVAHTSHVAHILASALTISVLGDGDKNNNFKGCASGFRDTSRTASSDPVMWRQIVDENQQAILDAMNNFEIEYKKFRNLIEQRDFDGFEKEFAKGRTLRSEWLAHLDHVKKETKNV